MATFCGYACRNYYISEKLVIASVSPMYLMRKTPNYNMPVSRHIIKELPCQCITTTTFATTLSKETHAASMKKNPFFASVTFVLHIWSLAVGASTSPRKNDPRRCPPRAGEILHAAAQLNIVRVNANGLRTDRQRAFLGKLLVDLQVGVCIVTESHLRKRGLKRVKFKNYVLLADSRRLIPIGEHITGGVIILVHVNFTAAEPPRSRASREIWNIAP